jgi:putative transposase
MKKASPYVLLLAEVPISFQGYQFPPDIISYAMWLDYQLPLDLRMVEAMLAARESSLH